MAGKQINFKGLGETAAENDALAQRRHDAKHGPGPDLSPEACHCGAFGPWGDGSAFYCPDHVPPQIRFAAQFYAETIET